MMRWSPRLMLVVIMTAACGCAEFLDNALTRHARFEPPCVHGAVGAAVEDDGQAAFRAYEGPAVKRQAVAVVAVPAISDSCVRHDPHVPYWFPYVASVDERRDVLGPDRKTGKERRVRLGKGQQGCKHCHECLRLALMPGPHVMIVGAWTWGSVEPDRKDTDLRGSVEFPAQAGGLYSIRACQPNSHTKQLFWVRDEGTLGCVSSTCPEG